MWNWVQTAMNLIARLQPQRKRYEWIWERDTRQCGNCQTVMGISARYCPYCGLNQLPSTEPITLSHLQLPITPIPPVLPQTPPPWHQQHKRTPSPSVVLALHGCVWNQHTGDRPIVAYAKMHPHRHRFRGSGRAKG